MFFLLNETLFRFPDLSLSYEVFRVGVPGTTVIQKVRANIVFTFFSICNVVYYAVRVWFIAIWYFLIGQYMTHFRLLLNGVSLPKDYVSLRKDSHLSKEGRNSSSSLKRTWFFVSWLAKHIRNPIRIDLNRKTGRTWTPDSFLSSRMPWSSLLPCLG